MVFIFQFVIVIYHIDWFVDIEESLHPWDKAHLVIVYDLFNVLLDSDCYISDSLVDYDGHSTVVNIMVI